MEVIKYSDYKKEMGELIYLGKDLSLTDLIAKINYSLDKNKVYYIMCDKGVQSKKAVSILKMYQYNAIQVLK